VFFLNRKVEMERLTPLLKELVSRDPETALALNADKDAPFGSVMRVMDSLKEAGVKTSLTAFMEKAKK
jgi:biopolymer transport protein ExbD